MKACLLNLLLLPHLLSAQEFSGEITYIRKIIPTDHRIKADSILDDYLGDSSVYTISGSYYKSTFYRKGKETYTYIYHHPEFRFYHILKGKDYITYSDSQIRGPSLLSSITPYRDSVRTVAGYRAYKAEKFYFNDSTTAYYSDDVRIDPNRFKGHDAGDWHYELTQTNGAISLRSVSRHEGYVEIFEAVRITKKQFHPLYFQPPENMPVIATESVLDKKAKVPITVEIERCFTSKSRKVPEVYGGKGMYPVPVFFVVTDKGEIQHVNVMGKSPYGLDKIAIEVIKGCGFKATPGEIDGEPVSSEYMMMLTFKI